MDKSYYVREIKYIKQPKIREFELLDKDHERICVASFKTKKQFIDACRLCGFENLIFEN